MLNHSKHFIHWIFYSYGLGFPKYSNISSVTRYSNQVTKIKGKKRKEVAVNLSFKIALTILITSFFKAYRCNTLEIINIDHPIMITLSVTILLRQRCDN